MKPIVQPSPEVAEDLRRLRENRRLVDYLRECANASRDKLVAIPDDEGFRAAQGRAQTYQILLEQIVDDLGKR